MFASNSERNPMPTKSNRTLDALRSSGKPGLVLPEDLTFEECRDIGLALGRDGTRHNWEVGDWWAFVEHHYGKRTAIVEADDWTGPAFQTCANLARVARAFETSRRREALSFSHHAELASVTISPKKADELLDWCLDRVAERGRPRSIRDLRLRLHEFFDRRNRAAADAHSAAIRRQLARYPSSGPVVQIMRSPPVEPEPRTYRVVFPLRPPPAPKPEPEPGIALDTSGADSQIPPGLAELQEEPPPKPDRVEIARAAFDALTREQQLEFHRECAAKLGLSRPVA
jgi:hypothetical protein